jgi:hypothetical protein
MIGHRNKRFSRRAARGRPARLDFGGFSPRGRALRQAFLHGFGSSAEAADA